MEDRPEAEQLTAALLHGEPGSIEQLAEATPEISDRVATALARELKGDHATRVCELIPRFDGVLFPDGRRRLFDALTKACNGDGSFESAKVAMVKQRARPGGAPARPASAPRVAYLAPRGKRQLVSGFRQLWVQAALTVIAFVGLVMMLGLMSLASLWVPLGMVVSAALVLLLDALLRTCPACTRLLAAKCVAIKTTGSYTESVTVYGPQGTTQADRTTHSIEETWECVCCGHRWTT